MILARSDTTKVRVNVQWLRDGLSPGSGRSDPAAGAFLRIRRLPAGVAGDHPPTSCRHRHQRGLWGAFILGLTVVFRRKAVALPVVGGTLILIVTVLMAGGNPAQPTRYFLRLVFALAFVALIPGWGRYLPRWRTPSRWRWEPR